MREQEPSEGEVAVIRGKHKEGIAGAVAEVDGEGAGLGREGGEKGREVGIRVAEAGGFEEACARSIAAGGRDVGVGGLVVVVVLASVGIWEELKVGVGVAVCSVVSMAGYESSRSPSLHPKFYRISRYCGGTGRIDARLYLLKSGVNGRLCNTKLVVVLRTPFRVNSKKTKPCTLVSDSGRREI